MENLKQFTESSTIHGLAYWATSRRLERYFWIFIVFAGFIGAGIIIEQSFQSWHDSPIKTTLDTLTIEQVTFPKINVCPPRGTNTNLNYDLIKMAKNDSFNLKPYVNELRENFISHFQQLDYKLYLQKLKNDFQEKNQFRNWFTGKRLFKIVKILT